MNPQAISMLGSIGISGANALSQHLTNQHNERLVGIQNRMNIEQWYRENAYNDPSAVMARLRRAGLNPALIYENGAQTSAASSPMMQAPQDIAPQMTGESIAQLQLLQTQAKLNDAQAKLKGEEVKKVQTEIDFMKGQIKVGESVVIHNQALTALTKEQQKNLTAQTDVLSKRMEEMNASIAQMQANTNLLNEKSKSESVKRALDQATTDKIVKETGWIDSQAKLYQQLVAAQILNYNSQNVLNEYKGKLTDAQINEVNAQAELIKVNGEKASFDLSQDKKYSDTERSMKIAETGSEIAKNTATAVQTTIKAVRGF